MKKTLFILLAALLVGASVSEAQTKKSRAKAPKTAKVTKVAKAPKVTAMQVADFNGSFTNSYSDGIGGLVTHMLVINFDEATGKATGTHTNDSGEARTFHGTLEGNKLVCFYDDNNEKFDDITMRDANTLRLSGFTGSFKRDNGTRTITDNVGPAGKVPVDPNLYEIQRIQKQKEQEQKEQ